jgi:hypothetical protein
MRVQIVHGLEDQSKKLIVTNGNVYKMGVNSFSDNKYPKTF